MSHPADRERHDPHVGMSNPNQSLWDLELPYLGPPEDGQPRAAREPAPAPPPSLEPSRLPGGR